MPMMFDSCLVLLWYFIVSDGFLSATLQKVSWYGSCVLWLFLRPGGDPRMQPICSSWTRLFVASLTIFLTIPGESVHLRPFTFFIIALTVISGMLNHLCIYLYPLAVFSWPISICFFWIYSYFVIHHHEKSQRDFACLWPHFNSQVKQEVMEWHKIVSFLFPFEYVK